MSNVLNPENFQFLRLLGRGTYAKQVALVQENQTKKLYAIKTVEKEKIIKKNQIRHILEERHILMEMNGHPFICQLHCTIETPLELHFILDYYEGGELFYHLLQQQNFNEEIARFYAAEVLYTLQSLHENGILYRDMKPENIILDSDGHIRFIDFGFSKCLEETPGIYPNRILQSFDSNPALESLESNVSLQLQKKKEEKSCRKIKRTYSFCGTPEYLSPEVIQRKGHSFPTDIWSFGCFLYELVTGSPPYIKESLNDLYKAIQCENIEYPDGLHPDVVDLLHHLLVKNEEERYTIKQIMEHPYFQSVEWNLVGERKLVPPIKPSDNSEDLMNYINEEVEEEDDIMDTEIFTNQEYYRISPLKNKMEDPSSNYIWKNPNGNNIDDMNNIATKNSKDIELQLFEKKRKNFHNGNEEKENDGNDNANYYLTYEITKDKRMKRCVKGKDEANVFHGF